MELEKADEKIEWLFGGQRFSKPKAAVAPYHAVEAEIPFSLRKVVRTSQ